MSTTKKNPTPHTYAASREEWRKWLKRNHAKADEVWLIYHKKQTGKPTITYRESVEEALCFGWIDGILKSLGEQEYTHRFTPRRAGSNWSALNIRLAKQMIADGKMTRAGLAAFEAREDRGMKKTVATGSREITLLPETEKALKANKTAWKNFNALPPSHRKQYIGWIQSAKREETRARRVAEAIKLLAKNEKLGMR